MNKLFGICPHCGFETEIKNTNACYCMCEECGEVYNIMGHAKVHGVKLSEDALKQLIREVEKDISGRVSNGRVKW